MTTSSIYSNQAAKEEILSIYQEKLDSLGLDYEMIKVTTSYGDTNIVVCGDKKNPPLVLIHGSNGNSAIAIEPLIDLCSSHCIYAIDVIGQPNYSSENRPSMKSNHYAIWLDQVLNELSLNDVIIYGMSFGGFILMKALIHTPLRIKEAILHVPAGIVNGNPFIGIFKVFLPMKNYIKTQNPKKLEIFLNTLFTQPDEFAYKFLAKVLQNLKMDFSPIPLFTKKEISSIRVPVHIIGAKLDCFFPGEKVIKKLSRNLKTLGQTLIQNDSKHVPNKKQSREICKFIKGIL